MPLILLSSEAGIVIILSSHGLRVHLIAEASPNTVLGDKLP